MLEMNKEWLTLTKPPKTNVPPNSIPAAMTARNIFLGATMIAAEVEAMIITTLPLPTL